MRQAGTPPPPFQRTARSEERAFMTPYTMAARSKRQAELPATTNNPWIIALDENQRIVSSNHPCQSLVELSPDKLPGRKFGEATRLHNLALLIGKGFCFSYQPILAYDQKLICSYEPLMENRRPAGGILTIDRTDLDDSQCMKLPEIIRILTPDTDLEKDGIIVINREGIITMTNQAFAEVVGTLAQDMAGRHVLKAYPNSKLSRLPIVMQTGEAEIGDPHLLNGRNVTVSRFPLIKSGKVIGALGKILFKDIRQSATAQPAPCGSQRSARPAAKRGDNDPSYSIHNIIGQSKTMQELKNTLLRVAERGSNVLLIGESGTGKELFAHAIHCASRRHDGPFIKVNCAAIPEHLLESELFGYAEGAFTGAKKGGQAGKFEQAHGGTIFLDEIGDMSLPMQAKLLRVLQEKEISPLGSSGTRRIDVRVVAATNVDLQHQVGEGKFRKDLYYRLNIVALTIPALRERVEDIGLIARHLIETFNAEFGLNVQDLDPAVWAAIKSYDFPGNIRELRNAIESAFNAVTGDTIRPEHLPPHIFQGSATPLSPAAQHLPGDSFSTLLGSKPLVKIMEQAEKNLLEEALKRTGGNKLNAANLLGISRPGLYKKLQKHALL